MLRLTNTEFLSHSKLLRSHTRSTERGSVTSGYIILVTPLYGTVWLSNLRYV
jgi:hypothetical protein